MTTIPEIKASTQSTIQSSALTQDDIARMPKSFTPVSNGLEEDTFETKKESHVVRNSIIAALVAAAAIVGLKHCKFMNVEEGSTKFLDKFIKKPINKLGEWIEWPFVTLYKKIKGDKADDVAKGAAKSTDDAATGVGEAVAMSTDNTTTGLGKTVANSADEVATNVGEAVARSTDDAATDVGEAIANVVADAV